MTDIVNNLLDHNQHDVPPIIFRGYNQIHQVLDGGALHALPILITSTVRNRYFVLLNHIAPAQFDGAVSCAAEVFFNGEMLTNVVPQVNWIIKSCSINLVVNGVHVENPINEIAIMEFLVRNGPHANLMTADVSFLCLENHQLCTTMPYFPRHQTLEQYALSLRDHFVRFPDLRFAVVDRWLNHTLPKIYRGLMTGIAYMHSLGVAHRDIRLENILLVLGPNDDLRIPTVERVLIIDFGGAFRMRDAATLPSLTYGLPEFREPQFYDVPFATGDPRPSDLWACGILQVFLINLFTTRGYLFRRATPTDDDFRAVFSHDDGIGGYLTSECGFTDMQREVATSLLQIGREDRRPADEVLAMMWLQLH